MSLKLVLTLRGHEDHVWSVDMDKDIIVTGAWDSRYSLKGQSREIQDPFFFLFLDQNANNMG